MRHNDQYRDNPQPEGAEAYFATWDADHKPDLEGLVLASIETFDDVAETYRIWRAMPAKRMAEVIAARLEAAGVRVAAPPSEDASALDVIRQSIAAEVKDRTALLDARLVALRDALDRLPRLWWCSGWGTLNEMRHHGNADACAGESCGNVAYVRDVDLRAALEPKR